MQYQQPTPEIQKNVKLEKSGKPIEGEVTRSTQGTRQVTRSIPDFMHAGPWSSIFVFKDLPTGRELLRLEIYDHGNTIAGHWLNEHLYYIEVWWGRIAASNIIVDVDSGKIVYHELAHYGELLFCAEATRK